MPSSACDAPSAGETRGAKARPRGPCTHDILENTRLWKRVTGAGARDSAWEARWGARGTGSESFCVLTHCACPDPMQVR